MAKPIEQPYAPARRVEDGRLTPKQKLVAKMMYSIIRRRGTLPAKSDINEALTLALHAATEILKID